MRGTDTLVSKVDETRPDIGVPHHVRRNRVERGTSATLSEPFTIRSRETYRFHGSDPLPFHQGSLVDALFATTIRVCACVSSIVLFVTYRFTYDRISCVGGRTSAYRVPRKSAPLSSTLFPFRPLSVEGTRKLAFVGAANSKGDVLTLFVEVHAVYDRFVALNYLWMKTPPLSSKLLLLYIIVVSLFGRGWFKKFGFLDFYCHIFFVIGVL